MYILYRICVVIFLQSIFLSSCTSLYKEIMPPEDFGLEALVRTYKDGDQICFDVDGMREGYLDELYVRKIENDYSFSVVWHGVADTNVGGVKFKFPIVYGQDVDSIHWITHAGSLRPGYYKVVGKIRKVMSYDYVSVTQKLLIHGGFFVNTDFSVVSVNDRFTVPSSHP
jgi:hypothetical protein